MTDIDKAPQDKDVLLEQQLTPKKPDLLRELAWMTLTGRADMHGQPYLTEEYAMDALFGTVHPTAESEKK